MYPKTAKQILNKIKNPKLDLARGQGYWYFIYDDLEAKFYETKSIYCCYLNQMELDRWVEDGKDFVAECEAKIANLKENPPVYHNMSMIFKNMEK